MSKTDKTRPYWVQMRDSDFPYKLKAYHRPHKGECDIDFPLPPTRRQEFRGCEWWTAWKENDKIYGRSGWRRTHPGRESTVRADLRRLRSNWIKETDREEIDSNENLPTQRWLWRRWYWD